MGLLLLAFALSLQLSQALPSQPSRCLGRLSYAKGIPGSSRVALAKNLQGLSLRKNQFGKKDGRSRRHAVVDLTKPPPPVLAPPSPPKDTPRKKYGGGRNRSDGVYLLSQVTVLQVVQEWKDHKGESSAEFRAMIPKIMIWSTGIEYPYPSHWSVTEYPPKFVLGYYKKNVIESIILARGTTPEYAPHALTFVTDFIAVDPDKNVSKALPVLEKIRNIGIAFRVPIDYTAIKNSYNGEIEILRNSLGDDPSFNYWVMQNSGKLY